MPEKKLGRPKLLECAYVQHVCFFYGIANHIKKRMFGRNSSLSPTCHILADIPHHRPNYLTDTCNAVASSGEDRGDALQERRERSAYNSRQRLHRTSNGRQHRNIQPVGCCAAGPRESACTIPEPRTQCAHENHYSFADGCQHMLIKQTSCFGNGLCRAADTMPEQGTHCGNASRYACPDRRQHIVVSEASQF